MSLQNLAPVIPALLLLSPHLDAAATLASQPYSNGTSGEGLPCHLTENSNPPPAVYPSFLF